MKYPLFEITTLALSFAGVIWKVSQVQNDIQNFVIREISRLEKTLDIHITSQLEKEEMTEYLINDCKQAIEHKANRLNESIKEIKSGLEKKGVL